MKNKFYTTTNRSSALPVHNWYLDKYGKVPFECTLKKTMPYENTIKEYESKMEMAWYFENDLGDIELSYAVFKLDEEGTLLYVSTAAPHSVQSATLSFQSQKSSIKIVKKEFFSTVLFTKNISEIKKIIDGLDFNEKSKKIESKLHLLSKNPMGYYLQPIDVDYKKLDLDLNYNDDLIEIDKIIMEGLKNKKSNNKGLILLYGPPGAGKTTYIRNLVKRNSRKKFVIVPNNMVGSLTEPMFLDFLTKINDLVLILEESEQTLAKRESKDNSSISNVLNMSDGLLGDCLNFKIIATFNTDLKNIDEALLRKGRLLAKYEFKDLNDDKAKVLKKKLGVEKEMSNLLTNIYNHTDSEFSDKKVKIGFKG